MLNVVFDVNHEAVLLAHWRAKFDGCKNAFITTVGNVLPAARMHVRLTTGFSATYKNKMT